MIEQLGLTKALSVMLNKILLELSMNMTVHDLAMLLKECQDPVHIILWLNRSPVGDVPKVLKHIPLVFNDHVMRYDASIRDPP